MAKKSKLPAKYETWLTKDGLLRATAWARNGLTYAQIAHNMGVASSTLSTWRNKYPELDAALSRGKEVVDIEVENAVHKRALGYTIQIRKAFKVKHVDFDPDTGKKIAEREAI